MSNFYVRSTTGNNANNGTTWALAKADIAGALAIAFAGDTVWVSQAHAEVITGTTTWTGPGTLTTPVRIVCGNDAATPPTALATTATASNTTGFSAPAVGLYVYGVTLINAGVSSTNQNLCDAAASRQVWESCGFTITNSAGSSLIGLGGSASFNPSELILISPSFKVGATTQVVAPRCKVRITGGSWLAGGTAPTQCFRGTTVSRAMDCVITGFDFSNLPTGQIICDGSSGSLETGTFIVRYCKLPTSWSGTLLNGTTLIGFFAEMHGCAAGATPYQYWRETGFGTIKHETTIVMTSAGGASDGTTPLSHKLVTPNSSNLYPATFLQTEEFVIWNDLTGSARTVVMELIRDSVTNLQNADIWMDVVYLGDASTPLGSIATTRVAVVTAAADLAASSATWTNSMANPNKQKMSVTVTPQQKGPILCVVSMALKNTTAYLNPKPIVT